MNALRRLTLALIAALALSTAGAGAPPSASARDYWRDCGNKVYGAIIVSTKAHAVSCRIARRVAKKYSLHGTLHPLGFDCTEPIPDPSGETQKGRCTREGARIRIVFGI